MKRKRLTILLAALVAVILLAVGSYASPRTPDIYGSVVLILKQLWFAADIGIYTDGDTLTVYLDHNNDGTSEAFNVKKNSSTLVAAIDASGVNIASGLTYRINGSQISSANLSNDSSLAKTNYATTKRIWIPAAQIMPTSAAGAAAAEEGNCYTLAFADSSADDNALVAFTHPYDLNETAALAAYIYYTLPSGTPEEGEWDLAYLDIAEGGDLTASQTEVAVKDTPSGTQKLDIAGPFAIPAAALTDGKVLTFKIYHDVTDAFGGTVELVGLRIDYTSDKP